MSIKSEFAKMSPAYCVMLVQCITMWLLSVANSVVNGQPMDGMPTLTMSGTVTLIAVMGLMYGTARIGIAFSNWCRS